LAQKWPRCHKNGLLPFYICSNRADDGLNNGVTGETNGGKLMKILVLAKRNEAVPAEEIRPHVQAEIKAVLDLYAQGICREFYTRADQPGPAILMIESASVETAKQELASLPLVERHMIELDLIPLAPFTALTQLVQERTSA
jgi:hypothetical protein